MSALDRWGYLPDATSPEAYEWPAPGYPVRPAPEPEPAPQRLRAGDFVSHLGRHLRIFCVVRVFDVEAVVLDLDSGLEFRAPRRELVPFADGRRVRVGVDHGDLD